MSSGAGCGCAMSPSKSLSVVPISGWPYQGSAKIVRSSPAGTMQAALARSSFSGDERQVGAAAGSDPRHLGLVVDLLRADAVGPDPGRVDHVGGGDLERLAGLEVGADHPAGHPVLVEQAGDLGAIEAQRPEALRLAEDRQHQADVVGLAVVEEVGARSGPAAPAPGSARSPRRPGSCGGGRAPSSPRSRSRASRSRRAWPTRVRGHDVVHVEPDPEPAQTASPRPGSAPGTASGRRGAAPAGPSAGAPAAPRGPGRGRSSAGSGVLRGPSSTSGWRFRCAQSARSTIATV